MPATTPGVAQKLGQRICELRRERSYTQRELAERADISVSFLSMIERAERVPHLQTLASIASALDVTLSQLFAGVNGPQSSQETLLPLIAYLLDLRLESKDVEALLLVAKTMFKKESD